MLECKDRKSPVPLTKPVRQADLGDIPPEEICFCLQQMLKFFQKCERLSLPVHNPVAFLDGLRNQFKLKPSPYILEQSTTDYLPLLLLYNSYGNSLFCAGERFASDMVYIIKDLLRSANSDELRTNVLQQLLAPVIMQQTSHDVMRKAYVDGADFFYWEERNQEFESLQNYLQETPPLNVLGSFFCPLERSVSLWDIFTEYFKLREKVVPNTSKEKQLCDSRKRLICAVKIRELHCDFHNENTPADKFVLQTYTRNLLDILMKYPAGLTISEHFQSLFEYYKNRDDETIFDNINIEQLNKSEGKPDVRNAALILLLIDKGLKCFPSLEEQMEMLLNCYNQEPLYFFSRNCSRHWSFIQTYNFWLRYMYGGCSLNIAKGYSKVKTV